jgi:hypothetical protein
VAEALFASQIQELLAEAPLTGKGGLLTQIFIPKNSPLDQAVYRSKPYGLPYHETCADVLKFFKEYESGTHGEDDKTPQIRFLPSVLFQSFKGLGVVRYTYVSSEKMHAYAAKVERVVQEIFKNYNKRAKELEQKIAASGAVDNSQQKDQQYDAIVKHYLDNYDPRSALVWAEKIESQNPLKKASLNRVMVALLDRNQFKTAEELIAKYGCDYFPDWQEHLIRLCKIYSDRGCLQDLQRILDKIPDSEAKHELLETAA